MLFQVIKFVVIDRTEHNSQLEDSPQLYFSWVKEWNPHLLILEEDRLLSGFVPLLAAPQDPCYVEKTSDKVSPRPNVPPPFTPPLNSPDFFILGKFSVQTEHD